MTDTNDRYVKTGVFLAPFHPLARTRCSRSSATWTCWSISTG